MLNVWRKAAWPVFAALVLVGFGLGWAWVFTTSPAPVTHDAFGRFALTPHETLAVLAIISLALATLIVTAAWLIYGVLKRRPRGGLALILGALALTVSACSIPIYNQAQGDVYYVGNNQGVFPVVQEQLHPNVSNALEYEFANNCGAQWTCFKNWAASESGGAQPDYSTLEDCGPAQWPIYCGGYGVGGGGASQAGTGTLGPAFFIKAWGNFGGQNGAVCLSPSLMPNLAEVWNQSTTAYLWAANYGEGAVNGGWQVIPPGCA